jgi:hypothetical protein
MLTARRASISGRHGERPTTLVISTDRGHGRLDSAVGIRLDNVVSCGPIPAERGRIARADSDLEGRFPRTP